jgi:hypothetical protein
MAGANPSAADIQFAAGKITLALKLNYDDAVAFNGFLLRHTDAELVALGIPEADVAILKSAFADLAYQRDTAFNSSNPVKLLWGLGI